MPTTPPPIARLTGAGWEPGSAGIPRPGRDSGQPTTGSTLGAATAPSPKKSSSTQPPRSIVGIDPSPGQLDYARGRPGAAKATFSPGDAENLPVADHSVDVSTMGLVIAFVPNPERALSEMKRVTRPGGAIHTYMWDLVARKSPMAPLQQALRQMDMAAGSRFPPRLRPGSGWSSFGSRPALSRSKPPAYRWMSASRASLTSFNSATLPSGPQADRLRGLTPDQQRAELEARLRQTLPEAGDGSVSYEAVANAVRGRVPNPGRAGAAGLASALEGPTAGDEVIGTEPRFGLHVKGCAGEEQLPPLYLPVPDASRKRGVKRPYRVALNP